ncbi:MAG TPA: SpaA isopeptide-forming pilin-related protein [Clostridia bacterium]|nr:SpaA isopeptide-forming pilin-related protein [Clostridia bacterium]
MTTKWKRILGAVLLVILLAGMSATALAANVTGHDLYDWFEYYRDGAWHDLNTSLYFDMTSGNVGYCVEHEANPPRESLEYIPFDPATMFAGTTMTGIQAILNHGFPATNAGFSDDDAFYATANAIRFWIKESCGQGYDFMLLSNGRIRVKSGGETVWSWCMELLNYARAQDVGSNASVYLSTFVPKWSLVGDQLVTTLNVTSTYGYSVTPNQSSVTISGYTGGRNDNLTITAPASLIGSEVSLYFTATVGNVSSVDLGWYEPYGSTRQKLVFVEMITGTTGMSQIIGIRGEFYDLTIHKTDAATGGALDGATFQLTQNASPVALTQTANGQYVSGGTTTQFTTSDGTAVLRNLPAGNYQVVEVSAPASYVVASPKSVTLTKATTVTIANAPTQLTLHKIDALSDAAMSGVLFRLLNSNGNPVPFTQTADGVYQYSSNGVPEFYSGNNGTVDLSYLPIGTYALQESQPSGYATMPDRSISFDGTGTITIQNQPTALQFTKMDSVTGEPLDGGVFQLRDGNGEIVPLSLIDAGEYWKNAEGEITFTTNAGRSMIYGLPSASYTIEEITAPSGYTKAVAQSAQVNASHSPASPATATMADSPLTIRFTKLDALTGDPIDGAEFSLYSGETLIKLRKISDGVYSPDDSGGTTFATQNGVALIAPVAVGTYTISEEKAAAGFAAAEDVQVVVTESTSSEMPAVITMSDAPLALQIKKVDSLSGQPIGGATFKLYDSRGNTIKVSPISNQPGWFKMDENGSSEFMVPTSGVAMIAYLPQGRYELQEVSPPKGFALSVKTVTAVVGSYNTYTSPASVTIENEPLAMLLDKVDASDKSPLAGVMFRIKDAQGAYLRFASQVDGTYHVTEDGTNSFETGSDGKAKILYIHVGTYTLEEQQHPGFAPTAAQEFSVTAENTINYPAKVGVENWPLYLSITKTDKLEGRLLANVFFKVLDHSSVPLKFTQQEDGSYKVTASGNEVVESDTNGKILISHIPVGEYQLIEQEYDRYSQHTPIAVTVNNANTEENPAPVSVENYPTEFTLTKIDADTRGPLSGVSFTLLDSSNKIVSFALMLDGTYRPASPIVNSEEVVTRTTTIATDAAGKITIRYLPHGTYTLNEKQVEGYVPLAQIPFEITSAYSTEDPLTMTVENTPASLSITKINAITNEPLFGSKFSLLDENGALVKLALQNDGTYRPASGSEPGIDELTVDPDGTATIRYITGRLTIHESHAPAGFAYTDDQTIEVGTTPISIGDDGSAAETHVTIADLPLMLKISKIHAKTLKPLNGAAFQIMTATDTSTPLTFLLKDGVYWHATAGTITTITLDSNAQAYVCSLPAGKYRLVESVVPSGFFPSPAKDFTLQLTDTSENPLEIAVTNTPEVKLGLDSDKWDDVLLIGGAVLSIAGITTFFLRKKKRTH